jgi:hypothetical protein
MRTLILAMALSGLAVGQSQGACFGSSSFSTCNDASGNSYTVQRFGNQTMMNGYNAQTGSNWSQNSMNLGNMTITNGTTNGRPWNETQQNLGGGMRSIYGTNSYGAPFNYTCTPYGGCTGQ